MFLLKTLGQIIIVLAGATAGIFIRNRMSTREMTLKSLALSAAECETLIKFKAPDVGALIEKLSREEQLKNLDFLHQLALAIKSGKSPGDAYSATEKESASLDTLTISERETTAAFFTGLGSSGIEGQIKHCALYEKLFSVAAAEANQTLQSKGRVAGALSLSLALLIVVITF